MTGIGLATKGKICSRSTRDSGFVGGGIIYRDREVKRKPTKKECESLYLPKVRANLIKIFKHRCENFLVKVKLFNDKTDKL
jgi:hypothetical protein